MSGLPPWRVFARIELPLAWPGIATALPVLTFAHTLGEFGVVLMVGEVPSPAETQTIAIAIYDRVRGLLTTAGAGIMSAVLLARVVGAGARHHQHPLAAGRADAARW